MSPIVTGIDASSPPGFALSRATIARDNSMPATGTPREASGIAMRPVPIANSSARPPSARAASRSSCGPMTAGSSVSAVSSSYVSATSSSNHPSLMGARYSGRGDRSGPRRFEDAQDLGAGCTGVKRDRPDRPWKHGRQESRRDRGWRSTRGSCRRRRTAPNNSPSAACTSGSAHFPRYLPSYQVS